MARASIRLILVDQCVRMLRSIGANARNSIDRIDIDDRSRRTNVFLLSFSLIYSNRSGGGERKDYLSQMNCLNLFRLVGRMSFVCSSSFSSTIFRFPFVGCSSFSSAGTFVSWIDDLFVEVNFDLVINEGFQADNSSDDAWLWPNSSFPCCCCCSQTFLRKGF